MTEQYTQAQFINNVSIAVADQLPLMSYDSANILAQAYMNTVGWYSTDLSDAAGLGYPNNNDTVALAVKTIVDGQINATRCYEATATISVGFNYYLNVPTDQTPTQVQKALTTAIQAFLTKELAANTTCELISLINLSGSVNAVGYTAAADRVIIYANLINPAPLDPRVIALQYVNTHYAKVDATWNVFLTYTDNISGLCIVLKKFTDTSFSTIDTTVAFDYVIVMDRETFSVQSGLINNYL